MGVKQWKINQPGLEMVNIPPIGMVMTGGMVYDMVLPTLLYQHEDFSSKHDGI